MKSEEKKLRFVASAAIHKVYKYKKTYVAKVIIVTKGTIESVTSDKVFEDSLVALDYAKGMAENMEMLEGEKVAK